MLGATLDRASSKCGETSAQETGLELLDRVSVGGIVAEFGRSSLYDEEDNFIH